MRVRFRHPLARLVVYHSASPEERRRVHAALADVSDTVSEPDRLAWHRAAAAREPDEDVAAELERSAGRGRDAAGHDGTGRRTSRAARLSLLRGRMAFRAGMSGESLELLLDAAGRYERLDARLARETYLEALSAALLGHRAGPAGPCRSRGGPAARRRRPIVVRQISCSKASRH